MMDINTKGFNKQQWDLFYSIKNTEFKRDTFKADCLAKFDKGRPFFVNNELAKYTRRIKTLRAGLIEVTCSIENSQDKK